MDAPTAEAVTSNTHNIYAIWGVLGLRYVQDIHRAVVDGGGLRKILRSFWFGKNR